MRVPFHAGAPCAVLLTAAACLPAADVATPSVAPAPLAIRNVNVLPMDRESVLAGQTVIVEGGLIARMGPAASTSVPSGATVVDGTGRFLMPGLVDLHVHLSYNPEDHQRVFLKMFVANGVTTVLNLRGKPQILELRAAVAEGRVLGPRLFTSGPFVNEPFVTTPDEVEQEVVEQRRAGYDFVKLHGDLSGAAYARLNMVARREKIRVVGHAPRNLGLESMFEERQYALVHGEEFLYDRENTSRDFERIEPQIPGLARSMVECGISLMPNLTAYAIIGEMARDLSPVLARPEVRYLPAVVRELWGPAKNPYTARFGPDKYEGIRARYRLLEKLVREFQSAGVRLLIGTDAVNTGVVPGFSTHDEMAALVAAGLTPFQALRAATANAAEFLTVEGQHGTVAPGQRADLLLLDASPLENIANTRRIAGVALRGRWLSREDLAAMLEGLREK